MQHASHSTAEQEAYIHILKSIREGRFVAGDRLIPDVIASEIGMSRMPVREALRRLATEGLVTIRPNRGCVVSGLTLDEIIENFEIRSVLEGLAVRLAAPRIDRASRSELQRIVHLMRASERRDEQDWVARHSDLHLYVCRLSGRPKLVRQIETLMITVEPCMRIYRHHVRKSRSADEAHRVLIDIISRGDPEAGENAMRSHVLGTVPLLQNFLSENAPPRVERRSTLPTLTRKVALR